eukprot:sb/3474205/
MLEKIRSSRGHRVATKTDHCLPCWNSDSECSRLPPLPKSVLPQPSPLRRRSQLADESRAILEYRARSLRNLQNKPAIDLQRVYDTSYRPTIRFPKDDRTALTTIKPQFIKATSLHGKENSRKVSFYEICRYFFCLFVGCL